MDLLARLHFTGISTRMVMKFMLPDYIQPDLEILFVGINPGTKSSEVGHHYAGHSNRFWKLLNEAQLVPCPVTYRDDWRLPGWGLGLTNIVARTTISSGDLSKADYAAGRTVFVEKVRRYCPRIIALLGITLYPVVFPREMSSGHRLRHPSAKAQVGFVPELLEGARVMVLPNPSGRNAHYSYQEMLERFVVLNRVRKELSKLG
ncbi:MAG: mismatch-specific DNA-glycosylase [Nitrospirales bacterium]|nr:MAG: mismatch-specific DNA-glycosylase [Nitrospirales bacterium]